MSQSLDYFKWNITRRDGFARSHVFRCIIEGADGNSIFAKYQDNRNFLLCKSASLPALVIGTQELKYFGRSVKYPGNRTYDTMSLTFFGTQSYGVRRAFEAWQGSLSSYQSNFRGVYDWKPHGGDITTERITPTIGPSDVRYDTYATITLEHLAIDGILRQAGVLVQAGQQALRERLGALGDAGIEVANLLGFDLNPNRVIATYKLFNAFPIRIGALEFGYDNDAEVQTYTVDFDYQYLIHEEKKPGFIFGGNRQFPGTIP